MLLVEEQRALIEKIVKANKNYAGNEDLFEDFCSEAFQKCYMIFNSTNSIQKIENYAAKVVHTSILSVLKNSGRVRRVSEGYVATKEIKVPDFSQEKSIKVSPAGQNIVLDFPDPKQTVEELLITKDCLQRIADAVCVIHRELPSQYFYDIFYLRYVKGLKQSEIAKNLEISQSEVSKRLLQLSKLISSFLDSTKS